MTWLFIAAWADAVTLAFPLLLAIFPGLNFTITRSVEYESGEPREEGADCSAPDCTPDGVIVGVEVTVDVSTVVVVTGVGVTVVCVVRVVDLG